jgi:hypothetical protein
LASNTEPAQLLRCAFAEAVISQELLNNVFVDFYFPSDIKSSPESNKLIQVLDWLSRVEPRRASICRSQIATVCCQNENMRSKIISEATQRVLTTLNPWIIDNREQLSNELIELFTEAVELWQPLQRADRHIVVKNDGDWIDEDTWQEYDDMSLLPNHQSNPPIHDYEPMVILFPRIFTGSFLIFHGYALYPTQAAIIAAKLECSQAGPNSGLRRRDPMYRTERRLSNAVHDTIQKSSSDGRREASHSRVRSHRPDRTASVSSTKSTKTGSV